MSAQTVMTAPASYARMNTYFALDHDAAVTTSATLTTEVPQGT